MRILLEAPEGRLSVIVAAITIVLLVAAVRALWRENASLRSELNTLHGAHQEIMRRLIEAIGERRGHDR